VAGFLSGLVAAVLGVDGGELLITALGFEPVDAGPLSNARYLEPAGEINIHFGLFLGRGTSAVPAWIKAA